MRTQEEILERIRSMQASGDIFGFAREVLIEYLDFECAKEFLKPEPETTTEEWEENRPSTDEDARVAARKYAEFAWGKVQDHRSLSAGRSIVKMSAWAWLLGLSDAVVLADIEDYAQYGAPKLKILCEAMGLPVPDEEWAIRMMRGKPCRDGCEDGCGKT
jgi:hypothetical protein